MEEKYTDRFCYNNDIQRGIFNNLFIKIGGSLFSNMYEDGGYNFSNLFYYDNKEKNLKYCYCYCIR